VRNIITTLYCITKKAFFEYIPYHYHLFLLLHIFIFVDNISEMGE